MGENEKLWFPIYNASQPMCNDVEWIPNVPTIEYVGIDTSGNPIYKPNTSCGTIPKQSPTDAQRFASAKAEMDAMAEKYKPIADKLVEEIYKSSSISPISEETAKAFEKSCNYYLETLSEVSKSLNPCLERLIAQLTKPTKRKKHYKPKFTL